MLIDFPKTNDIFFLLENTLDPQASSPPMLFQNPVEEIVAHSPESLFGAFNRMEAERNRGRYLVGYLAYEAGYSLVDKFDIPPATGPLLHFYSFDVVERPSAEELEKIYFSNFDSNQESLQIDDLELSESQAEYLSNINEVKKYLSNGDSYQVNYTFRMSFQLKGQPLALYRSLRQRQPVSYSAFLNFSDYSILSLSPELFIQKQGKRIVSKPIKGTMSRGKDAEEDQLIIKAMEEDSKIRSENVMIVDLIRNDLARIAEPGSVKTGKLFEVQTIPTLHQMVSTIEAEVAPDISFQTVMHGLFPCGSITGVPKIRTMEIINALESSPRSIYTGSVGYITPNNDFCFNVAIRTIALEKSTNAATLGIGGGIIHESDPLAEWNECLLKARFLSALDRDFFLIETMRLPSGENLPLRFSYHVERLQNAAKVFGFRFSEQALREQIAKVRNEGDENEDRKLRVRLFDDGKIQIIVESIEVCTGTVKAVTLSKHRVRKNAYFSRFKTSKRALYNSAYEQGAQDGFFDVLFLNETGHLAEGSRHNIFLECAGQWLTPPVGDGALPGVMRRELLENHNPPILVRSLTVADLKQAEHIYLSNSVNGLVEVSLNL